MDVVKSVGDPFILSETQRFIKNFKVNNKCLIGHNRWATTGNVTRKNAHPFEFQSLVGVHNGTLTNKWEMLDAKDFDTDSEALYNNIEMAGLKTSIAKAKGAYTLVWYDKNEGSINFLRNKERPLWYCFSEDNTCLFWASESWMLIGILARNDAKIQAITQLPEDMHLCFTIPNRTDKFEKPAAKEVKQEHTPFVGKIVDFTKWGKGKNGGIGQPLSQKKSGRTTSETFNGNLKGTPLLLEALSWGKDAYGARYVKLVSYEHEEEDFISYCHSDEDAKKIIAQKYWKGVCGGDGRFNGRSIHKVNYFSLTEASTEEFLIGSEEIKKDDKGNMIDKKEFSSRYSTCSWCCANVTFEEAWAAINHTDCVCASCANDPEIAQYLPK